MSDYWVSRKKYFCKYCDIYIADDAPSRQHHENGMRHKGNVERFVRGIYKAGEKRKRDGEEEAREMARVDRAAQLAYAGDIASGNGGKAGPSRLPPPVAAPPPPAPRKPVVKPSNPYANYSSAASLGIEDPDVARAKAEAEARRSQGVVGAWSYVPVEPVHPAAIDKDELPKAEPESQNIEEDDMKREENADPIASSSSIVKEDVDTDARTFKFKKRVVATGLGEIYDPGIIAVKPRAPPTPTPDVKAEETTAILEPATEGTPKSTSGKKWTKIAWKRAAEPVEPSVADDSTFERGFVPLPPSAVPEEAVKLEPDVDIKVEDAGETKADIPADPAPPASLFKKRRAPTGALAGARARGGRTFETAT